MVEVSLTVGKLDASLALLLTKDHHLIEFPTILLPNGVKAGSIVKIKCEQDLETEKVEAENFQKIQDEILNTFGKSLPKSPNLKIKNITQTSCVLEWDPLDLGTSNLKNLILYKDGKKLGSIPQPLTNKTTKLSGLPIDKTFSFQIKLDTTAGIYSSEVIEVTTHKMTDLSGITVCLGDLSPNDPFTKQDIEDSIKNIGARPYQDKIQVDTTHFICTRENKTNVEYMKAQDMNIPIIRPEWLKACERERRIVGVTAFYLKECVLPDIFAKNYWNKSGREDQKELPKAPIESAAEGNGHVIAVSEPASDPAQPDTETAQPDTETAPPDADTLAGEEPVAGQVTPEQEDRMEPTTDETVVEQPEISEDLAGSNPETESAVDNLVGSTSVEEQTVQTSTEPANVESKPVQTEDLGETININEANSSNIESNFDEVDINDSKTESTELTESVELNTKNDSNISRSIPTNDDIGDERIEQQEEPIIKVVDVSKVSIQSPQEVASQTALVEPVEIEEEEQDVEEQDVEEQDVEEQDVEQQDVEQQDVVEKEEATEEIDINDNEVSKPITKPKKKKNNKRKK